MDTNKTRIVEPDPEDPTAGFVDLPDGTVAFTRNGYDRWKAPFAKIGIDIDKPMTHEEHLGAMTRVLEVGGHRTSAGSALLAILETNPERKAQYEREAQPFRERAERMRRLGIKVVRGTQSPE